MKFAFCFLYIVFQIIYLAFSDGSREWGGFNICSHIAFVGLASYWLEECTIGNEKLVFQYVKWLSFANVLYITVCVFKDTYWIIYNTDLFAYIFGLGFLTFLFHCALNEK